jgi:hypothetical protein
MWEKGVVITPSMGEANRQIVLCYRNLFDHMKTVRFQTGASKRQFNTVWLNKAIMVKTAYL